MKNGYVSDYLYICTEDEDHSIFNYLKKEFGVTYRMIEALDNISYWTDFNRNRIQNRFEVATSVINKGTIKALINRKLIKEESILASKTGGPIRSYANMQEKLDILILTKKGEKLLEDIVAVLSTYSKF